jgi:hypothetical protein
MLSAQITIYFIVCTVLRIAVRWEKGEHICGTFWMTNSKYFILKTLVVRKNSVFN